MDRGQIIRSIAARAQPMAPPGLLAWALVCGVAGWAASARHRALVDWGLAGSALVLICACAMLLVAALRLSRLRALGAASMLDSRDDLIRLAGVERLHAQASLAVAAALVGVTILAAARALVGLPMSGALFAVGAMAAGVLIAALFGPSDRIRTAVAGFVPQPRAVPVQAAGALRHLSLQGEVSDAMRAAHGAAPGARLARDLLAKADDPRSYWPPIDTLPGHDLGARVRRRAAALVGLWRHGAIAAGVALILALAVPFPVFPPLPGPSALWTGAPKPDTGTPPDPATDAPEDARGEGQSGEGASGNEGGNAGGGAAGEPSSDPADAEAGAERGAAPSAGEGQGEGQGAEGGAPDAGGALDQGQPSGGEGPGPGMAGVASEEGTAEGRAPADGSGPAGQAGQAGEAGQAGDGGEGQAPGGETGAEADADPQPGPGEASGEAAPGTQPASPDTADPGANDGEGETGAEGEAGAEATDQTGQPGETADPTPTDPGDGSAEGQADGASDQGTGAESGDPGVGEDRARDPDPQPAAPAGRAPNDDPPRSDAEAAPIPPQPPEGEPRVTGRTVPPSGEVGGRATDLVLSTAGQGGAEATASQEGIRGDVPGLAAVGELPETITAAPIPTQDAWPDALPPADPPSQVLPLWVQELFGQTE